MNGIDRVMMSIDNSPWVKAVHSDNGKYTYNFPITNETKLREVRAIIYPKCGIPRVLQGPIEKSNISGVNYNNVRNGNHSMFINTGNFEYRDYHVSPDGNDETGDGSLQNPFKTIGGACGTIGDCNGVNLYLAAGDYEYSGPAYPKKAVNVNRYLWILPEPGQLVRIVSSKLGGLGVKLVAFNNIILYDTATCRTITNGDSFAWFDNCVAKGISSESGGGFASGNWSQISMTNCVAKDVRNCFRNATLIVNCHGSFFSDTPIGQDTVVYNCTFNDFIRHSSGDHADVFHWFYTKPAYRENRIISKLDVHNFSLQGWQVNPITNGGQQLDNVALIDIRISKDIQNAAGSWWYMDTNHLYMQNVHLVDQPLRWKVHGQDTDSKLDLKNVLLKGCKITHVWLPPEVVIEE